MIHYIFLAYIISSGRTFDHYKTSTILNLKITLDPQTREVSSENEIIIQKFLNLKNGVKIWCRQRALTPRTMQVARFCPDKKKPLHSSLVLRSGIQPTLEHCQEELSYTLLSCSEKLNYCGKPRGQAWNKTHTCELQFNFMIRSSDRSLMKHSPHGLGINSWYRLVRSFVEVITIRANDKQGHF